MKYNINDEVKIISGEYKNYKGRILEKNINNKTLIVEIYMYEKNIKVKLNFEDVVDLEMEV